MKQIFAYVTSDGIIHDNYTSAKAHAEKRYGDQLTKMAHDLIKIDKYTDMVDKLEGYKGSMQLLLDLSSDLTLEDEEQ